MKKKLLIIISVLVIAFIPFSIVAQSLVEHSYTAIDYKQGVVGVKCSHCDDYYKVQFADYINTSVGDGSYDSALDVVADGVINAKDYAKLRKEYPLPTTTTTTTTTTKKTTTKPVTDKDGWNNNIIKP